MGLSDHYYYTEKTIGDGGYTDVTNESFLVERIIANQPDFFPAKENNKKNQLKKNIIINTWCSAHIDDPRFRNHLILLMGEGFALFQVQDENLKKIETIHQVEARAQIDSSALKKLLLDNKIDDHNGFIFNYSQCQAFLVGDGDLLDAEHLRNHANLVEKDKRRVISESGLCLVSLDWDRDKDWLEEAQSIGNTSELTTPFTDYIPKVKRLVVPFNGQPLNTNVLKNVPHCEYIEDDGLDLIDLRLKKLPLFKTLKTLKTTVTPCLGIYKLLEKCPNVTHVDVRLDTLVLLPKNYQPLPQLKQFVLNLHGLQSISEIKLGNFFDKTPNLTEFSLKARSKYLQQKKEKGLNFKLFIHLRNIEKLTLNCVFDPNSLHPFSMKKLRTLDLSNCTLTAEQLNHLLENTPNIESLNLFGTIIEGTLKPISLPRLKALTINRQDGENTNQLINANTNLYTLFLSEIDLMQCQLLQQKNLRELQLGRVFPADTQRLNHLMPDTLIQLTLQEQSLPYDFAFKQTLPNLLQISVTGRAYLTYSTVIRMMSATPQLQEFALDRIQVTYDYEIKIPDKLYLSTLHRTNALYENWKPQLSLLIHNILPSLAKNIIELDVCSKLMPRLSYPKLKRYKGRIPGSLSATEQRDHYGAMLPILRKNPTADYQLFGNGMTIKRSQPGIIEAIFKNQKNTWPLNILFQACPTQQFLVLVLCNYFLEEDEKINAYTSTLIQSLTIRSGKLPFDNLRTLLNHRHSTNAPIFIKELQVIHDNQFCILSYSSNNQQLTLCKSFSAGIMSTLISCFPSVNELILMNNSLATCAEIVVITLQQNNTLQRVTVEVSDEKPELLLYMISRFSRYDRLFFVFKFSQPLRINQITINEFLKQHSNIKFIFPDSVKKIPAINEPQSPLPEFDINQFKYPQQTVSTPLDEIQWSQSLRINRLCAYARLTLPPEEIPVLQQQLNQGICAADAKWFADTMENGGESVWLNNLQLLKQWQGNDLPAKDSRLKAILVELMDYVFKYQFEQANNAVSTNQLEQYLALKPDRPIFIKNIWHRICLFFKANQWYLFDPNYRNGQAKVFSVTQEQALLNEIYRIQGHALAVISFHTTLPEYWVNDQDKMNLYLAEGGLELLVNNQKLRAVNENQLTAAALEGFFLLTTTNRSLWYDALSTSTTLNEKIFNCLNKGLNLWGKQAFTTRIANSLSYLTEQRRHHLQAFLTVYHAKNPVARLILDKILPQLTQSSYVAQPTVNPTLLDKIKAAKGSDVAPPETLAQLPPPPPAVITAAIPLPAVEPDVGIHDIASLQKALQSSPTKESLKRFITWKPQTIDCQTIDEFDQKIGQFTGDNVLLAFNNKEHPERYIHHLQASNKSDDLYIINSPADLKCSGASLHIDDEGNGIITTGPSGALYDFLQKHQDKAPRIVINWCNFDAQKLVQSNTVLDKGNRRADGSVLPEKAIVISLQTPHEKGAYLFSDFNSRHQHKISWPEAIQLPAVQLPTDAADADANVTLDFFNEANWPGFLHGKWSLNHNALHYHYNKLLKALQRKPAPTSLHLCLKNAPMHDAGFRYALNSLISERAITLLGKSYPLPEKITISLENGYDLEPLLQATQLQLTRQFSDDHQFTLNNDSVSNYHLNYYYENGKLSTIEGWLEKHKEEALTLYLTSELPLSVMARLLTKAKKHRCQLSVRVAPGVELPEEITTLCEVKENPVAPATGKVTLYVSNDLNCTEKRLTTEHAYDLIIDASELTKSHLFYLLSGENNNNQLHFDEQCSALWKALKEGKKVLLRGHLNADIADVLAPLFQTDSGIYHNGELEKASGELTVLTDNAQVFSYVANPIVCEETLQSRLALIDNNQVLKQNYAMESLTKLSYSYLKMLSEQTVLPENASDLLLPLTQTIDPSQVIADFDLSKEASEHFKMQRQNQVLDALKQQPTLLISGETGVGKSSFMHELNERDDVVVYFGDYETWASAENDGRHHILFDDETNQKATDHSGFNTLYSNPAGTCHKGRFDPIKKDAKKSVVFAANPVNANYSNRKVQELFVEHPNIVTFGPMSNAYLYHETLKPLLNDIDDNEQLKIAELFLKTWHHIKAIDPEAISARELQMMAYLLQTKQVLPQDTYARAKWYAHKMGFSTLKKEQQAEFTRWFENQLGQIPAVVQTVPPLIGSSNELPQDKFLLTASHTPAYIQLIEMLKVRQNKRNSTGKCSYGGLAGMVLEGEPGIGKSLIVKQTLLSQGLTEKNLDKITAKFDYEALKKKGVSEKASQRFYYLPASLGVQEKINALNYIFHTGGVPIIDELNSSELIEILNAFFMGEDLQGRRALKPGFTLIATQNPATLAGRKLTGLATKRRVITSDFPDYTLAEKVDVLQHQGCEFQEALELIYDFEQCRTYARKSNLQPEPCFRDLQNAGKQHGTKPTGLSDSVDPIKKTEGNTRHHFFKTEATPNDNRDKQSLSNTLMPAL